MPDHARIKEFIATVVSGDHVQAIVDFYHEEATMQENRNQPRRGRDALAAHEKAALSRLKEMYTHPEPLVLIDGDNVAIRWTFDKTDKNGKVTRLEEIAVQQWRGDRILHERFFYDSVSAWFSV